MSGWDLDPRALAAAGGVVLVAMLALWTWLRRRRVRTLAGGDRGAAAGSSVDDEVSDRCFRLR